MRRHGASPTCAFNFFLLFCNHPTRDAIAGVSGGVRLVIVGLGMNHNCSAFAEKGMRAVLQCDVAILKMDLLGRAIGAHGEVFHITGMVALGILESVLLSFWVEMSTRGFKVGAFALRNLMEMDGVLAGGQAMQIKSDRDSGASIPQDDIAYRVPLSVFEFHLRLRRADRREREQHQQHSRGIGNEFHRNPPCSPESIPPKKSQLSEQDFWTKRGTKAEVVHPNVEYTARKFQFFLGERGLMALNAVEQVSEQVPADDFQALEEKVYRTIEMFKAARQAQATAERDLQRLRQQMEDREEELVRLRRETVQLKKEREDIRGRVEKMLAQIESLAEAS